MALDFGLLKSEGDLRFDLVRVRENAGAVCPKGLGFRFLVLGEYDVIFGPPLSGGRVFLQLIQGTRKDIDLFRRMAATSL